MNQIPNGSLIMSPGWGRKFYAIVVDSREINLAERVYKLLHQDGTIIEVDCNKEYWQVITT